MCSDFFQTIEINEKKYTIGVDNIYGKRVISVNNIIISENNTDLSLKPYNNLFYTIVIDSHKITLGISENEKKENYDVFIDGHSVITDKNIEDEKNWALSKIQNGFSSFFKKNWLEIIKKEYRELLTTVLLGFAFVVWYSWKFKLLYILLSSLILPFVIPIFVWLEFLKCKNIVKKWDDQYQIEINYKDLNKLC